MASAAQAGCDRRAAATARSSWAGEVDGRVEHDLGRPGGVGDRVGARRRRPRRRRR